AIRARSETHADGFMIARGAINHPWIFREIKDAFENGYVSKIIDVEERIHTALKHLKYEIMYKEDPRRAIIPFRKYYSGYLKGLYNSSKIRQQLMQFETYEPIEHTLLAYIEELKQYQEIDD
ncbi:MAG: tRNA-dihydrouridine synthase, partial [Melioribacteraceae bacterium]|nr:tRNA-dihydrouridine synthase [Melioribacteraceae bacterium]